jgi:ParB family chromosome partitioning protein
LCEKFGYTHDDVAKILGKSRTTVTEALAIASLPEVIREECRRADITAKTTLLEIVRQPDDVTMRQALKNIAGQKFNREELRRARRIRREGGEVKKQKPFIFNSNSTEDSFRIEVIFKDGMAAENRVRKALLAAVSSLASSE